MYIYIYIYIYTKGDARPAGGRPAAGGELLQAAAPLSHPVTDQPIFGGTACITLLV